MTEMNIGLLYERKKPLKEEPGKEETRYLM